ncbi:hypothetical protein K2173_027151 [Erythroxylum novogranatense]|uniref:Bifunctional inhibitor/plant lipid transfer protein/seed storage helical domain-containing protein n=1 Tax=Erythroxylum novogranatense TaxID=1862640 RepID=A0AAV8U1I2_9ROSI|nr:hypothetical protein K2173_027151 [Erythroxylum novogranatense]
MESKFHFSLLLLLCSWVLVGVSQNINELAKAYGDAISSFVESAGAGGGASSVACMQKLLPCKAAVNSSSPPPDTCCSPLKEMVANETKCLCAVFNNPTVLHNFNITQDDALNLAKDCGAKPDLSLCENSTSSQTTATSPTTNSADSDDGSSSADSSDSSTKSNAADTYSYVELLGIVSFSVGLNLWAF